MAAFQVGQEHLVDPEGAFQIRFDFLGQGLQIVRGALEIDLSHDAGAVDDNVQCRKLLGQRLVHRADGRGVAHVANPGVDAG
ncbi:hypothetical protein AVKW3434_00360 [Acidovorax sp. SUPP3434]|nr:hypothetical protein AVKW3434_00360 [Acidovorax sp. SUPP3434]